MRKALAGFVLCACISPAFGQDKKASGPSTVETIKQLERDWTDAQKSADVDKLSQIIADDWRGLGFDGKVQTKKDALDDIKSGRNKITSVELAPMEVKVMGTVAIVQGGDTEKSSLNGKDTSGKWVWMDVFVKRDGKWQAVRSQSAMVAK